MVCVPILDGASPGRSRIRTNVPGPFVVEYGKVAGPHCGAASLLVDRAQRGHSVRVGELGMLVSNGVRIDLIGLSNEGVGLRLHRDDAISSERSSGTPAVEIENRTSRTIIAYGLTSKVMNAHGQVLLSSGYSTQVRGILTLEDEIGSWEAPPAIQPGARCIVRESPGEDLFALAVRDASSRTEQQRREGGPELEIKLENAVFRDGTYAGRRGSEFLTKFVSEIEGRRIAMDVMVRGHENHQTTMAMRAALIARIDGEYEASVPMLTAALPAFDMLSMMYSSRPTPQVLEAFVEDLRRTLQCRWFTLNERDGKTGFDFA